MLFVNGTEFQKEENGRIVLDDIKRLAQEYYARLRQSAFSFTVFNQAIANNDYSLRSRQYMKKVDKEHYNLKELGVTIKHTMNALVDKQRSIDALLNHD